MLEASRKTKPCTFSGAKAMVVTRQARKLSGPQAMGSDFVLGNGLARLRLKTTGRLSMAVRGEQRCIRSSGCAKSVFAQAFIFGKIVRAGLNQMFHRRFE